MSSIKKSRLEVHRNGQCQPQERVDITTVTSQCDSTTTGNAGLDLGPEFYQTTYAHLQHKDELLDSDEAGDEEEDNRDADVGDHRDDELLAKLLDPERNQHLTYDEIQRWASSIYDSEDESGDPSSLPVEATTPAQQRAETVVNPGAQTKLTAKEYALFQMQHKLKDIGLSIPTQSSCKSSSPLATATPTTFNAQNWIHISIGPSEGALRWCLTSHGKSISWQFPSSNRKCNNFQNIF